MRKILGWAAAAWIAGCLVVGACGGDDSNSGGPADSGTDAQTSDVVTPPGDAGGDDAIAPGPATITVHQGPTPFAGAKVVFYKPDGTALPTMTTGADGKATTTVSEGWSVTASGVVPNAATNYTTITTFMDIEPGDDLSVNVVYSAPPGGSLPTMTLSDPGTFLGATNYIHSNGCFSQMVASGPTTLEAAPNCQTAGKISVIVYAVDANGIVLATTEADDFTFSDGMTVSGLGLTWKAATNVPIAVTGAVPASIGYGSTGISFLRGGIAYGPYGGFSGGVFYGDAGTPSLTFATSTGSLITNDAYDIFLSTKLTAGAIGIIQKTTQAGVDGGYSVDFGALPPAVHDPVLTSDGLGTVTFSFSADGAIASLDGMETDFIWTAPDPADASTTDHTTWLVIAPPSLSTAFPKLSTDLAAILPPVASTQIASVILRKGTPFGSYAGFRKNDLAYGTNAAPSATPFSNVTTAIVYP